MASSTPLVNGDRGSPTEAGVGSLEEALEQMNILIMENRELKGVCVTGGIYNGANQHKY